MLRRGAERVPLFSWTSNWRAKGKRSRRTDVRRLLTDDSAIRCFVNLICTHNSFPALPTSNSEHSQNVRERFRPEGRCFDCNYSVFDWNGSFHRRNCHTQLAGWSSICKNTIQSTSTACGSHRVNYSYATITEPLHCVYKFDYDKYSGTFDLEDDNSPVGEVNRHKFYGWHTATLILLSLALLTTFMSICLGMCSCCYSSLAFLFTAITLLTTFLSVVAEGLFFFYSHRADNRFIKGIVGTYEQRVGMAFFLQMAACVCHFLAFLVSLLFTYFALASKSSASDKFSANRSSRTNMTNIGRSMEFDTPLIYSQQSHHQSQASHLRPPHYSKQDLFDRGVADSMPEISGGQSFPADILPPRVRRKSETCV
ncbi:hypothetical protein L596_004765 [Steinernema carpocapsae]|uniref:Clc-like protein n=1 Tax=Steinernema carpocapsae TaxID=34508 RepID=A0A4U8UWT1_STECR|nr:hypothetical protein L596_004765 [Steinernema carpocapsae]